MHVKFKDPDSTILPFDLDLAQVYEQLSTCSDCAYNEVNHCLLCKWELSKQANPANDEFKTPSTKRSFYKHQTALSLAQDTSGSLIPSVYEYALKAYRRLKHMVQNHASGDFECDDDFNRFMNNFVATINKMRDVIFCLHRLNENIYLSQSYYSLTEKLPSAVEGDYYKSHLGTREPEISKLFHYFREWLEGIPQWNEISFGHMEEDRIAAIYIHLLAAYARGDDSVVIDTGEYGGYDDWLCQLLDQEQWHYEQDGTVVTVTVPKLKTDSQR